MSNVFEIDASKAMSDDRAHLCAALISALGDWVIEHAPLDRYEVLAVLDRSSLARGVFEDGLKPVPRGATIDQVERAQLSVDV